MSTSTMIIFSVVEAALLIAVMGAALFRVRRRLEGINSALVALGSVLGSIEHELRQVGPVVGCLNAPLAALAGTLPGVAEKAERVSGR